MIGIVACSGGPDSMALTDILRSWGISLVRGDFPVISGDFPEKIIIAHIHHGLRQSADRDAQIVIDYCQKHELICEIYRADIRKEAKKTKTTIEECARNTRRDFLEQIRQKYNAHAIYTAHHADDQAETILYRLVKWTAITGLRGIEATAWYYRRPLLAWTKKDILKYIEKYDLPYGLDETNEDTSIPRNLLRHKILPELTKINPEFQKSLVRLSTYASQLRSGFDDFFAGIEIPEKDGQTTLTYDTFHMLPHAFQDEYLRLLYERANGSTHGLSQALIDELHRFLGSRSGGKKELGKSWIIKKQGKIYSELDAQ